MASTWTSSWPAAGCGSRCGRDLQPGGFDEPGQDDLGDRGGEWMADVVMVVLRSVRRDRSGDVTIVNTLHNSEWGVTVSTSTIERDSHEQPTTKPTRREERRAQTVREIKQLAMEQISAGGPDAVSLSGIVREMSMSPAAIYRYFANRDALLADLVVDAYDELADFLIEIAAAESGPQTIAWTRCCTAPGRGPWVIPTPTG